jgi:uncharacterized protein (TIGR02246 family)
VAAALVLASIGLASRSAAADCGTSLSADDAEAVRAVQEAYRTAWLRGDEKGVLATFTDDAVLLPAHGARPITGQDAIKRYWFPAGAPPTTITRLDLTIAGLDGDGCVAFTHGEDNVGWTTMEKDVARPHGHPGTYLNVLRKGPDGRWRIARHMWDDGPGE